MRVFVVLFDVFSPQNNEQSRKKLSHLQMWFILGIYKIVILLEHL